MDQTLLLTIMVVGQGEQEGAKTTSFVGKDNFLNV